MLKLVDSNHVMQELLPVEVVPPQQNPYFYT